jgi:hypothetical protein
MDRAIRRRYGSEVTERHSSRDSSEMAKDDMVLPSFEVEACGRMTRSSTPGAQTERRGDAGPVRVLLGGTSSPAALLFPFSIRQFE